jgi:hypothetical protein
MYPDDWRPRVITAVMVAICMWAAMILGPVIGIHGFWFGLLLIVVAILVGQWLGPVVDRRLFQPSSGNPPDHPPRA